MHQMAGQLGIFNPMTIQFGAYGAYTQAVGDAACSGRTSPHELEAYMKMAKPLGIGLVVGGHHRWQRPS